MVFNNKAMSLVFITILSSCAGNVSLTDEELDKKTEDASKAIISLITDLSCDSDQQCGAIKFGHKPCGGPAEYKLYSSKNIDVIALTQLAEEYFDYTKEYNRRNQISSDCSFVSPPDVVCNDVCKVNE